MTAKQETDPPRLLIGSKNYSSWSLRGWLMAKMAGLDFIEQSVALDDPAHRAEVLLLSPSILVPTLFHDRTRIWDPLAIGEYLNEVNPGAGLLPAGPALRAWCRAICCEMHAGFHRLRTTCPMNIRGRALPGYDPYVTAGNDIERIFTIWNECLAASGGPFLFGAPTMADAMYAPVVLRFLTYRIRLEGMARAYSDRILTWDPMAEWIEAAMNEEEEELEFEGEF
jgi:glutathione S-transferase